MGVTARQLDGSYDDQDRLALDAEVDQQGTDDAARGFGGILGRAPAMREIFGVVRRVARADVTVLMYNPDNSFSARLDAASARLEPGYWRLEEARFYASGMAATERETFRLKTTLTPVQVGESFATPETVPFWQLSSYIDLAENAGLAASGYRSGASMYTYYVAVDDDIDPANLKEVLWAMQTRVDPATAVEIVHNAWT